VLSGRGLCDELLTRPEESYRLCCVVVCDLETSRIGAPYIYIYIYDISSLRVKAIGQRSTESPLAVHAQHLHDTKIVVGRNTPLPHGALAYMVPKHTVHVTAS